MSLFDTKVKAYTARLQKDCGLKGFQADGFFGNFGEETAGFTKLHQVGGNGRGWAQWDDRRAPFEQWCADHGLSPESDEGNYGFLVYELLGSENRALQAVKATRTRDDATRVVMERFERPGVPALDVRIHWAIRAEAARLEQEKAMTDTSGVSTASPAQTIIDKLNNLEQKLEALGNQVVGTAAPQASGIVNLVERLVDPFLPALNAKLGAQIQSNALAMAIVDGLTLAVSFFSQRTTPTKTS